VTVPHAKFDDRFAEHPKVASLSDAAFRLHVAGILYCARLLTDGLIDKDEVSRLVRRFRKTALAELVDKGLWHEHGSIHCYEIHDYLQWNDSRAEVEERRERARKNARKRWK
jgi:hypothetical protein